MKKFQIVVSLRCLLEIYLSAERNDKTIETIIYVMQEGIIIHGDKINIGHPHPPSYQTCNHRHQWVYYCNHTQHKCLIMGNSKLVQLLSVIFIFTCRICNLLILIKSKKVVRLLELFIVIK